MTKRSTPLPVATQKRYEELATLIMHNQMNRHVLTIMLAVALEQLDAGLYVTSSGELKQHPRRNTAADSRRRLRARAPVNRPGNTTLFSGARPPLPSGVSTNGQRPGRRLYEGEARGAPFALSGERRVYDGLHAPGTLSEERAPAPKTATPTPVGGQRRRPRAGASLHAQTRAPLAPNRRRQKG